MSGDETMREFGKQLPVPEFETTAFTVHPKPLSESTVAIVTSAALHRRDEEGFTPADTPFETIDRADGDLVLGHWSSNFDRSGFRLDVDVVYPIDRIEEVAQ